MTSIRRRIKSLTKRQAPIRPAEFFQRGLSDFNEGHWLHRESPFRRPIINLWLAKRSRRRPAWAFEQPSVEITRIEHTDAGHNPPAFWP